MHRKVIVTISREYGSGGREVGKRLAEKLGIPFYDKKLLIEICKTAGINDSLYTKLENQIGDENYYFETKGLSFLTRIGSLNELSVHEQLYLAQEKVIQDIAKDSCVLIGRCSSYILRDNPDIIKIFIRGEIQDKIKRAIREYGEDANIVSETLWKVDTERSNYFNYFTNEAWGKASNYDLVINTTKITLNDVVSIIQTYVERRV